MRKIIGQREIYDIIHKATNWDFLQSTGCAVDPSWKGGVTSKMIFWHEGEYEVPTYSDAIKMVFNVKPISGHGRDCDDHSFRDKVNVTDYCLDVLGFVKPPTFAIASVSPFIGRNVTHSTNILIHEGHTPNTFILRIAEPQNTRYTYAIDPFLCTPASPLFTELHTLIF